ncbi:hypothetical protein [Lysobacter gummosus]|uniref:hypothetical protein n=1 Tax=Lysobacter gummosus TaxID=262324 RepID=UPI00363A84D4
MSRWPCRSPGPTGRIGSSSSSRGRRNSTSIAVRRASACAAPPYASLPSGVRACCPSLDRISVRFVRA